MIEMILDAAGAIDAAIAVALPATPRVAFYGVLSGAASMGLYAVAANQRKIAELKDELREVRSAMMAEEDELAEIRVLLKRNLKLTLRLSSRVLGPSLLAAMPVLVLAAWLEYIGGLGASFLAEAAFLPEWLRDWPLAYFGAVLFAAIAVKIGFRIE
ncbi:MAG: hypothetical protein VX107_03990 [Pseudomonadota bacterium]|nr:hypothetical protein [Pseudomonadota bacterium]